MFVKFLRGIDKGEPKIVPSGDANINGMINI